MEYCKRANRSDIHLSMEEEAKLEEETRKYFDGIAPNRHSKPQRSEYSTQYKDSFSFSNGNGNGYGYHLQEEHSTPEFLEFQRLQTDPQKLNYDGEGEVREEFAETEYYKDLNCIDKHHHTTGTGFIKMQNANGKCFGLALDSGTSCHASSKGNPATNDWIPSPAYGSANFASDKPKRSDN